DHRTIAFADASSAGQQSVLFLDVGINVEGDCGDIVKTVAFHGFAVERLEVAKSMGVVNPRRAHLIGGQRVKHEGVVGVGTMRDGDLARLVGDAACPGTSWTADRHAWDLGLRRMRTVTSAANII